MAFTRCLRLSCVVVVLSGLLLGAPAPSAARMTIAPTFDLVGQAGFTVKSLAARGNLLYVASGRYLLIVDASDPTALRVVGQTSAFGAEVSHLALAWPYAYAAWFSRPSGSYGQTTISIVDVSTATAPLVVCSVDVPTDLPTARYMAAAGRHVWLSAGSSVWMVDASDLSVPQLPYPGRLPFGATRYAAEGQWLCVSAATTLQVYDYASPRAPVLAGECITPNAPHGVAVAGSRAYVADNGLAVVDLSDPATPVLSGHCATPHTATEVAVSGNRVYALDPAGWLMVMDVSNPVAPAFLGQCQTSPASVVAVVGNRAYMTTSEGGITIVDLATPSAPAVLAVHTPIAARAVAVADGYAYVAGSTSGLTVFDVADPTRPVRMGNCAVASLRDLAVWGAHAYLATNAGLTIVDISNPAAPTTLSQYPTTSECVAVLATENLVYLRRSWGVMLLDVSAALSPTLISSVDVDSHSTLPNMVLQGDLLYVAKSSGLAIIDVADAYAPEVIGTFTGTQGMGAVAVVGDTAYVSDFSAGLYVVDISDPTSPDLIQRTATWARSLAVAGNYLAAQWWSNQVGVLEISTPRAPESRSGCAWLGSPEKLAAENGLIYAATLDGGLVILRVDEGAREAAYIPSVRAGEAPPQSVSYELASQIGGTARAVAVQASVAYLGVGMRLATVDVSAPASPALLGQTELLEGLVADVGALGDTAYVLDTGGLAIVDASDPAQPVVVQRMDMEYTPNRIAISGNIACISDSGGLTLLDVSVPHAPAFLARTNAVASVSGLALSGQYLYALAGPVYIFDLAQPDAPELLSSTYEMWYGTTTDVAAQGDYMYVTTGNPTMGNTNGALLTYDVSNPAAPRRVDAIRKDYSSYNQAVVEGNRLCIVEGQQIYRHLVVYDLANPAKPALLGSGSASGDMVVAGGIAYFANSDGLALHDVSPAGAPHYLSSYVPTPGAPDAVFFQEGRLYVSGAGNILYIYDAEDPSTLALLGFYAIPGTLAGLLVNGHLAYVITTAGQLRSVDLADPTAPAELGTCSAHTRIYDMAIAGQHLYMMSSPGSGTRLSVINIADPAHPLWVGEKPVGDYAMRLVAQSDRVYVLSGAASSRYYGSLAICDVSQPATPTVLGSCFIEGQGSNLELAGNYVYISNGCQNGLTVVDVADAARPQVLAHTRLPRCASGILLDGQTAYLSCSGGFMVMDVSSPTQARLRGIIDLVGSGSVVATTASAVYVNAGAAGLFTLRSVAASASVRFSLDRRHP